MKTHKPQSPIVNRQSSIVSLCFCAFLFLFAGCAEPLRFAPSEPQKQTAELTHLLAEKIKTQGTEPQSPASVKLCEGTRTVVAYMGRPKTPPDPEQFDIVVAQANQDAVQRPDPWSIADNVFELAIGISALLGGVYGTKAVRLLKCAREKSQALQEIVAGNELFKISAKNELFKISAKNNNNTDVLTAFKDAQNQTQKSTATKRLVTELKS